MTKVINFIESLKDEAISCADTLLGRVASNSASGGPYSSRSEVSIVVVHGFLSSSRDMRHWVDALSRTHATYTIDYGSFGKSFKDIVEEVSFKIKDIPGNFILLGHSLGGIVCRAAAERNPERCLAVVTVCSPNTLKDVGIFSRITAKIASQTTSAIDGLDSYLVKHDEWMLSSTGCHTVGAEFDAVVTNKSSRLKGATHITINKSGHMSVLRRYEVVSNVLDVASVCEKKLAQQ